MIQHLEALWQDEAGTTSVEYALLVALIVVPGLAAWQGLRTSLLNLFDLTVDRLSDGS